MAMYHHSDQNYEEAKSDAAKHMLAEIKKRIEDGKAKGRAAVTKLANEVPQDYLVRESDTEFVLQDSTSSIVLRTRMDGNASDTEFRLHPHAFGQVVDATPGVKPPRDFVQKLLSEGQGELAVHILNELYHRGKKRHMLRTVGGVARGFLSDSYRRLDTRVLLDTWLHTAVAAGATVYEGHASDTRTFFKAILEQVYEPVKDELIAIGLTFEDSEYGVSSTRAGVFIERCWCTNKAIMATEMSETHLGSRVTDTMKFSDETIEADTHARSLMLRDTITSGISQESIQRVCALVRKADETKVDSRQVGEYLKNALGKAQGEKALDMFDNDRTQMLPKGETLWRFSNVLDLFAQSKDVNAEERQNLQKMAGDVLRRADVSGGDVVAKATRRRRK